MLLNNSGRRSRRLLAMLGRPRAMLALALVVVTAYYWFSSGPAETVQVVKQKPPAENGRLSLQTGSKKMPYWDIQASDLQNWRDPDDSEDPKDVVRGYEQDGRARDEGSVSRLQKEKDMRKIWRYVYKATAK